MKIATTLTILIFVCSSRLTAVVLRGVPPRQYRDRGDVPGWVMITLMSAVLVAGLLALATPALSDLFNQAMSKVGK